MVSCHFRGEERDGSMNDTIDIASKETWERAKQIYLSTLSSAEERGQVERYFSTITSVTRENGLFVITLTNAYTADFLRDKYSDKLKKCLELVSSDTPVGIEFRYSEKAKPSIVIPTGPAVSNAESPLKSNPRAAQASTPPLASTMPLNEEYTFDNFVRGSSNSWALAAAQGVVANPGKSGYNPLFIHGGTGLGKTHLMQAIGNDLKKKNPSLNICYLTADTFLNEYVNALQNGTIGRFRNRYRKMDLLMVDDVQFLQKGKQCQEEFFNTFNVLQQAHSQVVMTSDVAPKNLPSIEARLISRFEGGMVQEIESPNYETRLAILKKKSEAMVPSIPDNALEFIAETIKSHVRAMEGALNRVHMFRQLESTTPLTNDVLTRILKEYITKENSLRSLTIKEIQQSVAKRYGVSIDQILSAERTQSLVTPRQMAMYISRKYTTKSLPEIAQSFKKTHATILHGVRNIEKRFDVESDLKSELNEILAEFGCSIKDNFN